MALRDHYYCDDTWYSCPLSIDGCADEFIDKNECNCGADEHNYKLELFYIEIWERHGDILNENNI